MNLTVKKHVNCSISHVFSQVFYTFFTGHNIKIPWSGGGGGTLKGSLGRGD